MTHHTEAERAEFEAFASDNGKFPKAIERDAKGDYLLMHTAIGWMWWQAARRAQAAPVPQCPFPCGWQNLHALTVAEGAFLARSLNEDEPITAHQRDVVMRVVLYGIEMARTMLAAAPQLPEAALVPSIAVTPDMVEAANEAYCPFGDMELALCAALQVAPIPPGAAPVQLPEPWGVAVGDRIWVGKAPAHVPKIAEHEGLPIRNLYTEQQVRRLLAAHGIQEQST